MSTVDLKKILIIEDEKPLAKALELKLNHEGFEAKSVGNGAEGLQAVENEKFDLILCDLIMPKVDGFAVLETLKKKNSKIPVIVLTNLGQVDEEKRARDLGAVGYYVKSNTRVSAIAGHVKEQLSK